MLKAFHWAELMLKTRKKKDLLKVDISTSQVLLMRNTMKYRSGIWLKTLVFVFQLWDLLWGFFGTITGCQSLIQCSLLTMD